MERTTRTPSQQPHHFDNFVGHYVRLIKTDGYARYGILTEIKKDYAYLRYHDGKQEAISCKLIDTMGDAPLPKEMMNEDLGFANHPTQSQRSNNTKPMRILKILCGFFFAVGGIGAITWYTTLGTLLNNGVQIAVGSGGGLALAAIGLYIIIMA